MATDPGLASTGCNYVEFVNLLFGSPLMNPYTTSEMIVGEVLDFFLLGVH